MKNLQGVVGWGMVQSFKIRQCMSPLFLTPRIHECLPRVQGGSSKRSRLGLVEDLGELPLHALVLDLLLKHPDLRRLEMFEKLAMFFEEKEMTTDHVIPQVNSVNVEPSQTLLGWQTKRVQGPSSQRAWLGNNQKGQRQRQG